MYKTLDEYDFINEFKAMNRGGQFSREGLFALFEYYEEDYDDNKGIELDVIAICCEWTEYTHYDLMEEYEYLGLFADIDELLEELQRRTSVIEVSGGTVLVCEF